MRRVVVDFCESCRSGSAASRERDGDAEGRRSRDARVAPWGTWDQGGDLSKDLTLAARGSRKSLPDGPKSALGALAAGTQRSGDASPSILSLTLGASSHRAVPDCALGCELESRTEPALPVHARAGSPKPRTGLGLPVHAPVLGSPRHCLSILRIRPIATRRPTPSSAPPPSRSAPPRTQTTAARAPARTRRSPRRAPRPPRPRPAARLRTPARP